MKVDRKFAFAVTAVIIVAVAMIAIMGGFGGLVSWFDGGNTQVPPGYYDDFAKCLTSKGVVMYGLKTCPHCLDQKKMFGSSFEFVTYVECSEHADICQSKGVEYVPAWEIGGNITDGARPLSELASQTGCSLQ
jgi:glutaredoxin